MRKAILVVMCVIALNTLGAFGTAKPLPVVAVEESDFNKFLENLPKVFGLSIGSALTDAEVSKLEKNNKGNNRYYFRRIVKPNYCISCDCYVTHEPLQQYYVSGFYAKADRTKCTEEDMLKSMCDLADLSLEGDVDKRGLRLHDAKNQRSVSIQTEGGNGCYYLITMKCDEVSKCLGESDRAAEIELSAKAKQEEVDAERKIAKENEEYKRLAAEKAIQAERKAQEVSEKEEAFNVAFSKALKSAGKCPVDVAHVGIEFPVVALCGFKLGDTTECVSRLLKNPVRSTQGRDIIYKGMLVKPFRKFKSARLTFHSMAGLYDVWLEASDIDDRRYSKEDIQKELTTIIEMLNKKFAVQLDVHKDGHGIYDATWEHEQQLLPKMTEAFTSAKVDPDELWLKKNRKSSIESIRLGYTRQADEFSLRLRSWFVCHLGDLVLKTINHKTFDSSDADFDAL